MGSIGKSLFGGTKKVQDPMAYQTLPDFGQDLLRQLVEQGRSVAGSTAPFAPVPLNPASQGALQSLASGVPLPSGGFDFGKRASAVFDMVPGQIDLSNSYLAQAAENIARGVNPITGEEISTGISNFMNPYLEDVVGTAERDLNRQFDQAVTNFGGGASNAGAFGDVGWGLGLADLARERVRTIGDVTGGLRASGFQSAASNALNQLQNERQNFLTGAGLNIGQSGQALAGGTALSSLGTQLMGARQTMENIRQQQRTGEVQNLLAQVGAGEALNQPIVQQNQIPLQQLALLQSIFGSIPVGGGNINTYEDKGLLGQIAGAAGGVAGGLGAMGVGPMAGGGAAGLASLIALSDRRAKEGIKKVGERDGLGVYEFGYKNKSGRYRGVMADEVMKVIPDAVIWDSGYMHVDYGKLNIPFERVGYGH